VLNAGVSLGSIRFLEFIHLGVLVAGIPELNRGLLAFKLREEGLTALSVAFKSFITFFTVEFIFRLH